MMADASVRDVLANLKSRVDALAVAVVARNGQVLWADLPEGLYVETFGVMCATSFGAASTVHSEMGRALPERVVIEGSNSATLIVGCGPHALLVAVLERRTDWASIVAEVMKVADLLTPP